MNSIGNVFSCITWGESHGKAIGCVIDGCPAGLELTKEDIKVELDRDIPIKELGTLREESNHFEILSGIFHHKTLGTPISISIENQNQKSSDYSNIKSVYRPGHADFGYHKRYGYYAYTGGGRSSGRVLISILAAGAIAKKILKEKQISISSEIIELGGIKTESSQQLKIAIDHCVQIGKTGDSTGGIVGLRVTGLPAGIGSPIFGKLHSAIMYVISTIGGVKSIECGEGIASAALTGSMMNDDFTLVNGHIIPSSNKAGGVLGGISTGNELFFKIGVKPTPSILKSQKSVDYETMKETELQLKGRFDINFTPRVGPLSEALTAIVLVDQMMMSGVINPVRVD